MTKKLERGRVSDEAASWLIRLQEEPDDPALRAAFEGWRRTSAVHDTAWTEVSQAFDLIGQAMPVNKADRPAVPFKRYDSAPISRRRIYSVGAMAVVAACLSMIFLPRLLLRLEADYATDRGEWREVRLADGSVVDLAPQTAIEVALAGDRRRVRLITGQAFFEVTSDITRPFVVEATGVRATALGTAFDVRLTPDAAAVAVKHGIVRVEFAMPSSARTLQAGDWTSASRAGQVAIGRDALDEIAVWRQGQLAARDRPISQVVDELRPYFNGMIVVASDAAARRRVTGVYTLRDPVEALRAVGRAHADITVTRVLPWLLVVSGG